MTNCTYCETGATAQCTDCGASLCSNHTQLGQQFISAWQLISTIVSTLFRRPGLLGELLFKELDTVGYCQGCRIKLASRRQAEQFKFLGGSLLLMVLVVGLVSLVAFV
jgi:hypothetical protein